MKTKLTCIKCKNKLNITNENETIKINCFKCGYKEEIKKLKG